jgi:glutamine amidotransferase
VRTDDDSALVASEPIDGHPGWLQVPDRHLVTARPGHCRLTPLRTPTLPDPTTGDR